MISVPEYVKIKKEEFKNRIEKIEKTPILKIISFDIDSSNNSYSKGLKKDCNELGINVDDYIVSYSVNKEGYTLAEEIFNHVYGLCDGYIMLNPIPRKIYKMEFLTEHDLNLDIYIPYNRYPCTPSGAINYLKYNNYVFENSVACIIGRSDTIGKPLAEMLLKENATVVTCHSKTSVENMKHLIDDSDLVFTCIDKIEYFSDEYFMGPKNIIDFGIGVGKDGKLHGNLTSECVEYNRKNNPTEIILSGTYGTGLLTRIELIDRLITNTEKKYNLYRSIKRGNYENTWCHSC